MTHRTAFSLQPIHAKITPGKKPAIHTGIQYRRPVRVARFSFFCIFFFILLVALVPKNSVAQAGEIDLSFNSLDTGNNIVEGAGNDVRTIALQPDGKILIGGAFTTYNGQPANYITRINADGSKDATFNVGGAGADSTVVKIVLQTDGRILLAGAFRSYNGVVVNSITRLNANGTRDATFSAGTGPIGAINALAVQTNGRILVGGNFTSFNGLAANYVIRLNTNGSRDASFNSIGSEVTSSVNAIAIQTNGKILIGMNNDLTGTTVDYLTRLNANGTTHATFNVGGTGANNSVNAIRIQPDGKILIGGEFSSYNGVATNLTRINVNGSIDATYNNTAGGLPAVIKAITLQGDGKILVGWGIYQYIYANGELEGRKLTRFNADGTSDATFQSDFLPELNENVYDIYVQPDGKILVGETFVARWSGSFSRYVSHAANQVFPGSRDFKINRYNSNGLSDQNFCINPTLNGANRPVYAIAYQTNGKILIGGHFFSYNGVVANYITRVNGNGTKDPNFNVGGLGFNKKVNAIAIQPDGKIIVGGVFTSYNSVLCNHLIRLNTNGSRDASFTIAPFPDGGEVKSLKIQPDGKILVGGMGTLTRLNSNGTLDAGFNAIIDATFGYFFPYINSIALQTDGKIVIGGEFSGIGGTRISNIARLNANGTRDITFVPFSDPNTSFPGTNSDVYTISIAASGKILIGGAFTTYNVGNTSTTVNHITRLNVDGTLDLSFNAGGAGTGEFGDINCLSVMADGKILAGGAFTSYNGVAVNRLIRINGDGALDGSFNAGTGPNNTVNTIALQSNERKFLIGGFFTSYNGTGKNRIARINNRSTVGSFAREAVVSVVPKFSMQEATGFDVKIFPNPSVSDFKLQVITSEKEGIHVSLFDDAGRLISRLASISPYQAINLGGILKAGSYLLEVRQGKNVKTTRLIKL